MIGEVITRLQAQVPDLANRVYGAADFSDLMRRKALPKHTPAAHVLGLGLQGGKADAVTGAFTQMFEEQIGVILTLRSHSRASHSRRPAAVISASLTGR